MPALLLHFAGVRLDTIHRYFVRNVLTFHQQSVSDHRGSLEGLLLDGGPLSTQR